MKFCFLGFLICIDDVKLKCSGINFFDIFGVEESLVLVFCGFQNQNGKECLVLFFTLNFFFVLTY